MNLEQLKEKCAEMGLVLQSAQIEQFRSYLTLLKEWNSVMDLTAICEEEEMIEKHFFDCLMSFKFFNYANQKLLDVGSGAGFPGLVLKIAFPDLKITLLEPTGKRVKFLNAVILELGLKDIEVVQDRAENYIKFNRSCFDVVTARAVARLNILLELTMPFVKVGGVFVALKGVKTDEEKEESKNALKELQGEVVANDIYNLSDGVKRHVLQIKKVGEISDKYPRNYGTIKKKPL